MALCPQEPEAILFADTVADEARITLRADGLDARAAEPLLDELGIGALAGAHPRDLSAGQRLLVAVPRPPRRARPVLLLDEPTRGLDLETKERLATVPARARRARRRGPVRDARRRAGRRARARAS